MTRKHFPGEWLVLFAAMLWGTTGTSQALAPTGATPPVIGALRLLVGGVVLVTLAWWRGSFKNQPAWPWVTTLVAVLGMAAYQLTFFGGVALTGVAVGTMVAIGGAPIFAGLLSWWFEHQKPSSRWYLATLLAVGGSVLLAFEQGDVKIAPLGVALAIGAGSSYAIYTLAIKRLVVTHNADAVIALIFALAGILLLPAFFNANLGWIWQPRGLLVIFHLGVFATALSYLLFARGLKTVSVNSAVTLTLAEPLTATMLGIFILGEQITVQAAAGVALIFLGLAILSFQGFRPRFAPKS